MPDERVDLRHEPAQHRVYRGVRRQHRLDRDVELHQPCLGRRALLVVERRPREHVVAEHEPTRVVAVQAVDPVELLARVGEVHAEVGEHVRVLRALARKDQRDLAVAAERLGLVVAPLGRLDPLAAWVLELGGGGLELGAQVLERVGDDREPPGVRRAAVAELAGQRAGELGQRKPGPALARQDRGELARARRRAPRPSRLRAGTPRRPTAPRARRPGRGRWSGRSQPRRTPRAPHAR